MLERERERRGGKCKVQDVQLAMLYCPLYLYLLIICNTILWLFIRCGSLEHIYLHLWSPIYIYQEWWGKCLGTAQWSEEIQTCNRARRSIYNNIEQGVYIHKTLADAKHASARYTKAYTCSWIDNFSCLQDIKTLIHALLLGFHACIHATKQRLASYWLLTYCASL